MNKCGNCGWEGEVGGDIEDLEDLFDRVQPGEIMPSCECPDCKCLCYWVADEVSCGFCGGKGYHIFADFEFTKCTHCNRFNSTFEALGHHIDYDSGGKIYDFSRFKLIKAPVISPVEP